jgi:hypothetical protein
MIVPSQFRHLKHFDMLRNADRLEINGLGFFPSKVSGLETASNSAFKGAGKACIGPVSGQEEIGK